MFRRTCVATSRGALTIAIAVLVACGGSSLSVEDEALVDALEVEIGDAAQGSSDAETRRCYAEGVVEALGGAAEIERRFDITAVDVEAGATVQTFGLERDDAVAVADALLECVDQARLLSADSGISYRQAECLLEEVDQGLGLNLSVAAGLSPAAQQVLVAEYDAHLEGIGDDLLAARSVCFN